MLTCVHHISPLVCPMYGISNWHRFSFILTKKVTMSRSLTCKSSVSVPRLDSTCGNSLALGLHVSKLNLSCSTAYNLMGGSSSRKMDKVLTNGRQNSTKDGHDENDSANRSYKTVYVGPLTKAIKYVKAFSIITSIMAISVQPALLYQMWGANLFGTAIGIVTFATLFSIGNPLLIHWVTKRYVINFKFDEDSKYFRAVTYTLFCQQKHLDFHLDDVVIPNKPMFLTTIMAKGHPIFVDPRLFSDIEAYRYLMGYHKPLEYFLGDEKEDDKK